MFVVRLTDKDRGIVQWQSSGLQNRRWGFEPLFPWLKGKAAFYMIKRVKCYFFGVFETKNGVITTWAGIAVQWKIVNAVGGKDIDVSVFDIG